MERIAFVFPDLLPMPAVKGGATETLIQRLIDDNEARGDCRFDIYCRYDPAAEAAAKKYRHTRFFYIKEDKSALAWVKFQLFRVRRKLSRGYVPESYLQQLLAMLKEQDYDSVIVESVFWFVPVIKKAVKAPVYLHLHFDAVASRHPDVQKALHSCDGVICVSRFIEGTILAAAPDAKTCVLNNVVDTQAFNPGGREEQAAALRAGLGIGAENKVVMYSGRLMRVKGVLELVRAFRKAYQQEQSLRLVLVGSAGYGENTQDDFYYRLVEEIGELMGKSVFLTGYVDHARMPDYFAMADIAVLPTTEVDEAAPLTVLEALASGCKLVGSDSGGLPELARCEDTVIVPRGEGFEDALANAILHWASTDTKAYPTKGQQHVNAHHSADRYYDHFLQVLKSL